MALYFEERIGETKEIISQMVVEKITDFGFTCALHLKFL